MKMNKLSLGMLAASVLAGTAHAQIDYYMYGSTAYRKATFDAVRALFQQAGNSLTFCGGDGGGATYVNRTAAAAGSVGDTHWVMQGTLANQGYGAQTITVHGTWAGSVGGLVRLTHKDPLAATFISAPPTAGVAYGNALVFDAATPPDIGMCDNQPNVVAQFLKPTPGYTGVHNATVAGVDFVIAANAGTFPAQFVNVSGLQLQALYNFGSAPLGFFTGAVADNTKAIYAVGRDDDSGTRAIFSMDIGAGLPATYFQYLISNGPYTYTYAGAAGINWNNDGAGYSGGGNVKTALQIANPGTYANGAWGEASSYAIAYLAVSDWSGSGLPTLSYNGVPYSRAAVLEGQYSYWGKENANTRDTDWTANTKSIQSFFNALTTEQGALAGLAAYPGTFALGTLDCDRSTDGQPIFHN
jgi:hypothetical protein